MHDPRAAGPLAAHDGRDTTMRTLFTRFRYVGLRGALCVAMDVTVPGIPADTPVGEGVG